VELSVAATPPIDKALLSTEGCFILDCGSEVFVWTGKKSPVKLRNATIKKAQVCLSLCAVVRVSVRVRVVLLLQDCSRQVVCGCRRRAQIARSGWRR
jgi:hypothetical protein